MNRTSSTPGSSANTSCADRDLSLSAPVKKSADGSAPAAKPQNDAERVDQLRRMSILDSGKDPRFDRLTTLAAELLDVPIVLVSLVDEAREWFKSTVGTQVEQISRDHGFCSHALLADGGDCMTVVDALDDERFTTHPFVADGPKLRFYCGAPLITASGHKIGMLCVHDVKPRPDFGSASQHILSKLAGIAMDEIDFHRVESERELLVGELSHRVKNVIGVVQSVARLSGRGHPEAGQFVDMFSQRLAAMAAAHDRLVLGDWKETSLRDVAAGVVAAHQSIDQTSITLDIPDLQCDPTFAQSFAMLVHELLTNANKYGALQASVGQVSFMAQNTLLDNAPAVKFVWSERGGPPAGVPEKSGFGHRLLDIAVQQRGGTVAFDWLPTGLVCRFVFPLRSMTGR